MSRLSKTDAIKTIQNRRAQVQAVLAQNVSGTEMSRAMRQTLDNRMVCCTLSDTELGMLDVEYLNDIIENGWWSEVGRRHIQRLLETACRKN